MKWLSVLLFPTVKVSRLRMPYFVNVCVCRGFMFSCVGVCICLCALHNLCGRTRPGNPFEVRGCACFLKRVVFFLFFFTNVHVVCAGL